MCVDRSVTYHKMHADAICSCVSVHFMIGHRPIHTHALHIHGRRARRGQGLLRVTGKGVDVCPDKIGIHGQKTDSIPYMYILGIRMASPPQCWIGHNLYLAEVVRTNEKMYEVQVHYTLLM